MGTAQQATRKAMTLWQELSREQQEQLLPREGSVIQFDTTGKEPVKVVSFFFGMDLCIASPYVYLFPDEARAHMKVVS